MGALGSLSKSATVVFWYISIVSTFSFGVVFLVAWLSEEFAASDKWKARRNLLIVIAIIGVAGEQVATLAEFALSEHLQTIEAGRSLSAAQEQAIAKDCAQFSGRVIFITSYSGDTEALRVGLQIKDALERVPNFHVSNELGGTQGTLGGVAIGIDVTGPDSELVNRIAKALRSDGSLVTHAYVIQPRTSVGPERAVNGIMVGAYVMD
jgi:hypothetical protein